MTGCGGGFCLVGQPDRAFDWRDAADDEALEMGVVQHYGVGRKQARHQVFVAQIGIIRPLHHIRMRGVERLGIVAGTHGFIPV
ncbi:hypothetical protein ASTA108788_08830 [Asticcacaulis taihuensis]